MDCLRRYAVSLRPIEDPSKREWVPIAYFYDHAVCLYGAEICGSSNEFIMRFPGALAMADPQQKYHRIVTFPGAKNEFPTCVIHIDAKFREYNLKLMKLPVDSSVIEQAVEKAEKLAPVKCKSKNGDDINVIDLASVKDNEPKAQGAKKPRKARNRNNSHTANRIPTQPRILQSFCMCIRSVHCHS